jgi:pSer/pThr/pTyr-binding forkhead associated (FHA) protein
MKTMLFPAEGELSDTGVTDVERLRARTQPGLKGVALGLTVIEQGIPPRRVPITQSRLTIGRGSCDLRVRDPEASREHCVIEVYDGVPTLKDLKSANGTLLNGQLVREHVLKDGDEITLGSTVLKVEFPKAA